MLYKRNNIYMGIIFFLTFVFSNTYAQVDKTNQKQIDAQDTTQHSATTPNAPQVEGDKVIIKAGSTILMEVEDEGTAGSIKLEDAGAVSQKPNKLYNNGGKLYWGSEQIKTASFTSNDWTISGNNIYNANSGDVGIGTTNPLSKLSVGGTGFGNVAIYGETSDNSSSAVYGVASNIGNTVNIGGSFRAYGLHGQGVSGRATNTGTGTNYGGYFTSSSSSGNGVFGWASNNGDYTNTGGFFISNGSAGQGVYGEASGDNGRGVFAQANGVNGRGGMFRSTGTSGIGIYASSTHHLAGQFEGDVYFNGKVGIGEIAPSYKLHVVDDSGGKEVVMIHNTKKEADSDGMIIRAGIDVDPTDETDYIIFQDGDGTTIAVIDGNGAGGVAFSHTSDRRLKTKIRDYTGALEKLSQLQVRKYERKTAPGKELIGLIAQEVQKVYPQIVSGSPDGDLKSEPMMVDYGRITPLLIKAIQEQQSKIEMLEKKLTELSKYIGSDKFSNVSR